MTKSSLALLHFLPYLLGPWRKKADVSDPRPLFAMRAAPSEKSGVGCNNIRSRYDQEMRAVIVFACIGTIAIDNGLTSWDPAWESKHQGPTTKTTFESDVFDEEITTYIARGYTEVGSLDRLLSLLVLLGMANTLVHIWNGRSKNPSMSVVYHLDIIQRTRWNLSHSRWSTGLSRKM